MYMLATGRKCGLTEPLYPLEGTAVPGGVVNGKKRNSPTTTRLSISICIPF